MPGLEYVWGIWFSRIGVPSIGLKKESWAREYSILFSGTSGNGGDKGLSGGEEQETSLGRIRSEEKIGMYKNPHLVIKERGGR